jgi:hypothetical protein
MRLHNAESLRLGLLEYGFSVHRRVDLSRDSDPTDFYDAKLYRWMQHAGDVHGCTAAEMVGIGRPDTPIFCRMLDLAHRLPSIAARYDDYGPIVIIAPGCAWIAKGTGLGLRAFASQFTDMLHDPGQANWWDRMAADVSTTKAAP